MHPRLLTTLAAAIVLVGGLNVAAYAATGGHFLLGRSNTAGKTSVLKNTGNGPALALKAKPGKPALSVNTGKKVTRLNADKVDGKNAADLETRPLAFSVPLAAPTNHLQVYVDLPPGAYHVEYALLANMSVSGARLDCWFNATFEGSTDRFAYSYSGSGSNWATPTASAVVLSSGTQDWLECYSSSGVVNNVGYTSQIVATPIDLIQYKGGSNTP